MATLIALIFSLTTLYQLLACGMEDRQSPPGKRMDVGGYCLHLSSQGQQQPTFIVDHSLGGVEGYLLREKLAPYGQVCIYDRAGYGWSDHSPRPRTSQEIVTELDRLLASANLQPPFILIGDSFGSYNMRLFAHRFPEKVQGLVLTDGLHEDEMLRMSLPLQLLKFIFIAGFIFSVAGAGLGLIRLLRAMGLFSVLKTELKRCDRHALNFVTRSFCRPKHWLTMARELGSLNQSSRQLKVANHLGDLPVVNIKAQSFFHPTLWTRLIPLKQANQLRDRMHDHLMEISSDCTQLQATQSSHFVWIDQPEMIVAATQMILQKTYSREGLTSEENATSR